MDDLQAQTPILWYSWGMSKRRLGGSLVGAICLIAISLLAVLTVGTSASMNVQMLLRSENAQVASLLADSAIQQALAELMKDPTWGNTASTKIQYVGPAEHSDVQLTFDKTLGVPFCSKNDSDNPLAAWPGSKLLRDGKVPGKRVHLVAVAYCRNVQRVREAVVYVPNFTTSLGATNKVLNGDLALDNCLLYVDGTLKVTGSVKGSGAVVVTGAATVEGGSGLTSADSVALLVRGDLSLSSTSAATSKPRISRWWAALWQMV